MVTSQIQQEEGSGWNRGPIHCGFKLANSGTVQDSSVGHAASYMHHVAMY